MNNFLTLTKVFFLSGFSVNKKKNSQKPIFMKLGLMGLGFLAISILYNVFQFIIYTTQGTDYRELLIFVMSVSSLLILILTFNQMQNTIFGTRDYEFVSSLPISNFTVISARISSVLLICIAEDTIILAPTIILYQIYTKDTFTTLVTLASMLVVSLIPLLISTILGTLIVVVTKRVKKKNIFQIIMYLMYFIVIFIISFSMNNSRIIGYDTFLKFLPHMRLYANAIFNHNIVSFLIFIGINIAAFIVVVFAITSLYGPINRMQIRTDGGSLTKKDGTILSPQKALFKKEVKMLTGNAPYLVNSMLGTVLFPLISIMLLVVNFAPKAPAEAQADVQNVMIMFIPFMAFLMNATANSASVSFSLEGRKFELLLSYPIRGWDVIWAKLKVAYILPALANLVGSTIVTIILAIKGLTSQYGAWLLILQIYLAPQLSLIFASIASALCNLRWPKLDFESDMQVMKNSQSVIYALLIVFLPTFVAGGIVVGLNFISYLAGLIAMVVVYAIAISVSYAILKNKGEELFNKIISR